MAGITYRFPTNVSLDTVVQEYQIGATTLVGEQILPFREVPTQKVQWDELDNERGMTAPHNMDADPKVGQRPGSNVKEYKPMYFKETDVIKESELLMARAYATLGGVVDLGEIVARILKARMDKNRLRAEDLRWQALTGQISINENGVKIEETFDVQVYNALVPWANSANSAPLKDLDALALMFRGTGATMQGAKLYLNRKQLNRLLENTNANDIAGFRAENFRNLNFSLADLNKICVARGLPEIVEYDGGMYRDDGSYRIFVPDDTGVVEGMRPMGEKAGDFCLTPTLHRTKNGMPAPGMFSFIEVNGQSNGGQVGISAEDLGRGKNPKIEITGGLAGGPRLMFKRSIIKMNI
jgi:hypothetical protein